MSVQYVAMAVLGYILSWIGNFVNNVVLEVGVQFRLTEPWPHFQFEAY